MSAPYLLEAQRQFERGEYFQCHEDLEAVWMKASGGEKELLQGLIQLAAAMHALELSAERVEGARWLYQRGRAKIEKNAALLPEADWDSMWTSWERWEKGEGTPCLKLVHA